MKKWLVRLDILAPAIAGLAAVGTLIWLIFFTAPSVAEVTVKVTEEFSYSPTLQAKPEVTATVMKDAGRWDAGDNLTINAKWPCRKLSCDWSGGLHLGMMEANRDASQLREGRCYTLILKRAGGVARPISTARPTTSHKFLAAPRAPEWLKLFPRTGGLSHVLRLLLVYFMFSKSNFLVAHVN